VSRLIKSGAGTLDQPTIRPLAASSSITTPPRDAVQLERHLARIADLERALERTERLVSELRAEADERFREGRDEGYSSALREVQDREDARLAMLEQGVSAAIADLRTGAAAMEQLAVLLAQECLDIMLGDASSRADIVTALIRHQVSQIDVRALLNVSVSREDFGDDAALERLCAGLGLNPGQVTAQPDRLAGQCTMVLQLGQMEVGLDQQWGVLRQTLGQMARPRGEP
jgi:flagellar biosynthesis/type III secretory pathway protein FliH